MQKTQLIVQVKKPAMLSGMCIPLQSRNVVEFGGINQALVYQQLGYLSKPMFYGGENIHAVRMSYTRLAKIIPSISRRWSIAIIAKLVERDALKIIKTKRVNLLSVNADYNFKTEKTPGNITPLLVFPELLKIVSPAEAILLQQIHIRCMGVDGSVWVIRSRGQLHSQILSFVSLATVNRAVSNLEKCGLLFVKPYIDEDSVVNSYRVNYIKLAEMLSLPMPTVLETNSNVPQGTWTSPLHPKVSPKGIADTMN